jgi:hypothetical protein
LPPRCDQLAGSTDFRGPSRRSYLAEDAQRGNHDLTTAGHPGNIGLCVGTPMRPTPQLTFEIRVQGRRLITTKRLDEARWAALAAARAGEGAEIVNHDTGEVIARLPTRGHVARNIRPARKYQRPRIDDAIALHERAVAGAVSPEETHEYQRVMNIMRNKFRNGLLSPENARRLGIA